MGSDVEKNLGRIFGVLVVVLSIYFSFKLLKYPSGTPFVSPAPLVVTKADIARACGPALGRGEFPAELDLESHGEKLRARVHYTLDLDAQAAMEKTLRSYRPDYAAFVALDANTGRILNLVSYHREAMEVGNLTLRSTFPAASIFKIVTAAAAIDEARLTPDTVIAFRGANHTLYKRNVTEDEPKRFARHMTIREAFAKSVNTVFGRLGIFALKPFQLQRYAEKFHFNREIAGDFPIQTGTIVVPDNDPWSLAEVASGFNRQAQMSPVQGAMIAASVVNDGIMMEPFVVDSLDSGAGALLYSAQPRQAAVVVAPASAWEMRSLMRETVRVGTSRKAFRDFFRKRYTEGLDIGGKTGSLYGYHPEGKYDWFVGYALRGKTRIAVAALTINEDTWRVKASYLARLYFDDYFKRESLSK